MTKSPAHNQAYKPTKDLLLLFSVPLGIIVLLVTLLYIPRLLANPTYDFIYCEGYGCDSSFSVGPNNTIQMAPEESTRISYRDNAELFYYDAERDTTRQIQVEEAARYQLDTNLKSPDGYTLKYDTGTSGFLFWGGSQRSWSLDKGFASKPLELNPGYSDKDFLGWVVR